MTNPLDLDAIETRANAATNGPWGHHEGDDYADVAANYQATGRGSYTCLQQVARIEADWHFDDPQHADCEDEDAATQAHADAAFVSAARTDVPALVAEIRRLRTRVAELEASSAIAARINALPVSPGAGLITASRYDILRAAIGTTPDSDDHIGTYEPIICCDWCGGRPPAEDGRGYVTAYFLGSSQTEAEAACAAYLTEYRGWTITGTDARCSDCASIDFTKATS